MAGSNLTFRVATSHTRWNLPIRSAGHLKPKHFGFRPMLAAAICTFSTAAQADLPLAVEGLLTDRGEVKLDLSLTYNNSAGEILENRDAVIGTAALRYGLTGKMDLYGRASYLYTSARGMGFTTGNTYHATNHRFVDSWLGMSYRIKDDNTTPALIGFAETALLEKGQKSNSSFHSWAAGITTYKSIDPIVFILSVYYSINLPRKDSGLTVNPGNTFTLNPSIAFSVNDRVTLNTGVRWTNAWPSHYEGQTQYFRRTNTDLQLGVDYGFSNDDILNVTFSSNVSGTNGTSLRFDWLHTF